MLLLFPTVIFFTCTFFFNGLLSHELSSQAFIPSVDNSLAPDSSPPLNSMGDVSLFFYGTLLAPPVLYRVLYGNPRPDPEHFPGMKYLHIRPALLHNYRRHRVIDADYPAILHEEGGCVRGSVVTGLTEGDRWRLDIFEGDQYKRKTVQVKILKDTGVLEAAEVDGAATSTSESEPQKVATDEANEVECETYVWISPRSELDPEEWDFDVFKRDKMRAWMGDLSDQTEHDSNAQANGVVIDSGFAEVDNAVAERARKEEGQKKDGTGGRGVNGKIGQELKKAQEQQPL